jgi:hypothetical protein
MGALIAYIKKLGKYAKINIIKLKYLNDEVKSVLEKYNFTLEELVYRLKNDILLDKIITCKYCGKPIKFIYNKKTGHYRYPKFCSLHCSSKYSMSLEETHIKRRRTCVKKYGFENYSQTPEWRIQIDAKQPEIREKVVKTTQEHYGVDNFSKSEAYRQRIPEIQAKMQETCKEEFGTLFYSQSEDYQSKKDAIIEKIKETTKSHYGVDHIMKLPEMRLYLKMIFLIKYGVDNPAKVPEFQEKMRKTCMERFNVDNFSKTEQSKQYFKEHVQEIVKKRLDTMRKNGTFNKSSFEEKAYQLLIEKFSKEDIERQYKSALYPFACDFHIKSLDLYIECNGHWTHYIEPFDKNNPEHIKHLEFLQGKAVNNKFYRTAIHVWTELDVKKLETFKKNKLNYKIFWCIEEVVEWLLTL